MALGGTLEEEEASPSKAASPAPAPRATQAPAKELTETQQKAEEKKRQGNELYKSRKFEEALKAYDEAIALDPNEILYFNNKAGQGFPAHEPDVLVWNLYGCCIECRTEAHCCDLWIAVCGLYCGAAVYMEMGDYAACLAECNKALERRYEVKADYEAVAKVLPVCAGHSIRIELAVALSFSLFLVWWRH